MRLRFPLRPRLPRRAVIAAAVAWLAVGIALFTVYLHVSRTMPVDSDGASNALQAWAMLHGNPLLRGWRLSDVSFYTTELPQYVLLEKLGGLTPDVVHVAAAMTYTLLVLAAAVLAKGKATGREGVLRAVVAIGIMLAPQRGNGVYVLMLAPDHTGSALPVLATWILLDRAPRRWYVPVLAGFLLTWALVADAIVLITGLAPLVAVAALRGYRAVIRRGEPVRSVWFEGLLIAMAVAAATGASLIMRLIASHGGFYIAPVAKMLAYFQELPHNVLLTLQGILLLFGADFTAHNVGYAAGLAALHLVGVVLAGWAVCAALRHFATADLAVQLLVGCILFSLAGYVFGRNAHDMHSTREFVAVLPCGAALAGRLLAGRLAAARLLPAMAVVATGYVLSLGQVAALPAAPADGSQVAAWLSARHLTSGLAAYWDSNAVTLDTGGQVTVRFIRVAGTTILPGDWETQTNWYNPARHQANFVIMTRSGPGTSYPWISSLRAAYGQPASINYIGKYTIVVWNTNLLTGLKT